MMRRLYVPACLIVLFLLRPGQSDAQTALVASASAGSTNGSNVTTSAIDTTNANLIVVFTSSGSTGASVSDSKSNTWSSYGNTGGVNTQRWYCAPCTVGSGHTFTAVNNSPAIAVFAFTGALSSPLDQQNQNGAPGPLAGISTGSITPTVSDHILLAATAGGTPTVVMSNVAGFTFASPQIATIGGQRFALAAGYALPCSTAAINPAFTWTLSPGGASAIVTSFKAVNTCDAQTVPAIFLIAKQGMHWLWPWR